MLKFCRLSSMKPGTDKLIIVAADPTNKEIPRLARSFAAKRYEVAYVRLKDLQGLIDKVFPPENEFLKVLTNSTQDELGEITPGEEEGIRRTAA